ncbi:Gypsy retrotransposon integrase-like protein 1 [Stylophora pistillata]|uniref:Gypsy retrotransposon integrase-like protein 1 n=1 Tax=Stylophora pistillata TaxID=50429 RepID=A0A2B4SIN7_STYPI|nr:Gypsy retrotransposon integrase-like protein 1 [Stylophora pistillata]
MYDLVFGTESFYPSLTNKQFVARLDHQSLVWLQSFKLPKPQEARWVEYLQQFHMKIEHRLGRLHANADGLLRRPWPEDPPVDKLEETNIASAPLIVETTTLVDESTPPEGMPCEPRQTPVPWSNEHFRTEQSKDKHLRAVRQWLEAGRRPPKQEMEGANRHIWSLWIRKTTDNVRKRFYWFGHTVDIELYCQTYHTCGSRNGPIPRPRAPMQSIRTDYPRERIQTDILGPLPETNKGNKFVAVVVDMYTKWPEAYALPDQEAETVAHAVMDNFICRFGCPRGVLSDQGHNFESRTFRGVTNIITKIAEEQKQWDQHLPKVLLALRASTHETTGFSPGMLMFGRELRLPIDAMRGEPPSEQSSNYPSFVKKQREILKEVQERVEKNVAAILRHQKDVYDARCKRRSRPYKKGDLVWLEEKAVPRWLHRKFHRPWSGPWRAVKFVSTSPTEYIVRKWLPCGRDGRPD